MPNRREIFKGFLRWLGLSVVAVFAGANFYKSRKSLSGRDCTDSRGLLACRQCGRLDGCTLPRAMSVKNHLKDQAADGQKQ